MPKNFVSLSLALFISLVQPSVLSASGDTWEETFENWQKTESLVAEAYDVKDYERALKIAEARLALAELLVSASLPDLIKIYGVLDRDADMEAAIERSLGIIEKLHGPDSPIIIEMMSHFASCYADAGNREQVEYWRERIRKIRSDLE